MVLAGILSFGGGLHGLALCVDKFFGIPGRLNSNFSKIISWVATMVFILVTWVFFRAESFSIAFEMIKKMFIFNNGTEWIYVPLLLILPVIIISHFVGYFKIEKTNKNYVFLNIETFTGMLVFLSVIMAIVLFTPTKASPFIYFQF